MLGHVNIAEFRAEYCPQSAANENMRPNKTQAACTRPLTFIQVLGPACGRLFQIVVARSCCARQLTHNCKAQIVFLCCDMRVVDP